MKPIVICQHLGKEKVDAYYSELSGKEVRAVLKAGGSHSNTPSTAFTQAARRKAWRKRFDREFEGGNEQLALALLIEWLMRHHRGMLVDYLDNLGVKHQQGETDEDFTETKSPEELRDAIKPLFDKYEDHHVATYLLLVGHLQETTVYDETPEVLAALGLDKAAADAPLAARGHVPSIPVAQDGLREQRVGRHAHPPREGSSIVRQRSAQARDLPVDPLGRAHQGLTGVREGHPPGTPEEERGSELLLQPAEPPRQGSVIHPERACRRPESATPRDREEHVDVVPGAHRAAVRPGPGTGRCRRRSPAPRTARPGR